MEKIITEKSDLSIGSLDNKEPSAFIVPFPEIDSHLAKGWRVKQMFVTPYGVNGTAKATDLVITVHLEKNEGL
ncbi:hypothetical protein [Dysgonomonas termitidis]|uniref:DUF4177 domain-containing protein n=1 Tax=Dysgonomonas termitidis TaxID=1516126 RepID=A0ABV9KUG5_9BACT